MRMNQVCKKIFPTAMVLSIVATIGVVGAVENGASLGMMWWCLIPSVIAIAVGLGAQD